MENKCNMYYFVFYRKTNRINQKSMFLRVFYAWWVILLRSRNPTVQIKNNNYTDLSKHVAVHFSIHSTSCHCNTTRQILNMKQTNVYNIHMKYIIIDTWDKCPPSVSEVRLLLLSKQDAAFPVWGSPVQSSWSLHHTAVKQFLWAPSVTLPGGLIWGWTGLHRKQEVNVPRTTPSRYGEPRQSHRPMCTGPEGWPGPSTPARLRRKS